MVAAAMAVAVAACVANVHGTAPVDASVSTTPDSAAEVHAEVTPIERWPACDPATGLNCPVAPCGNGRLDLPAETCDDGNTKGGDGCSASCQTETDWICAAPGTPCTWTVSCGEPDGFQVARRSCSGLRSDSPSMTSSYHRSAY